MSIILRPYQEELIQRAREALRRSRAVILEAPTGAGKTAMAATMTSNSRAKGHRAYFLCHRQELVDQTALTFEQVGIPHGYIAAGYPANPFEPVQVASIPTLSRRLDQVAEPTVVIWDECHHVAAAGWARIRERWSGAVHIGLTATPQRLDGKGLGHWFDTLVRGPKVAKLIEDGYLSDYRIFSHPERPDLSDVHTVAGDYNKRELADEMSRTRLVGSIVEHYKELGEGRRTVVFASSIKHSHMIVDQFKAAGIAAIHLDGETDKYDRRDALRDFALGKYQVVSNVALFGEGFDLAANAGINVTVDAVVSARPTQSLALWLQQCGRCLRPKEDGRPALILDHAGNALRHGLPIEERNWTLDDREKKGDGEAPVKECPQCFAVLHSSVSKCPECGWVFVAAKKILDDEAGKLEELQKEEMLKRERKRKVARARSFAELEDLAYLFGYSKAWARRTWERRKDSVLEEDDCHTTRDLVRLARKRGKRSPEAWARAVMQSRQAGRRRARV